ncbi:MAG TPA: glycosyltransferase family 2 protein [Polyangiaceae bacterium]|nr:glycosyltransferase family 2 protein [Polyangiaceae bacterium]
MRSVDVVIPVFNEVHTVKELAARLARAVPGATLVFVDNGSTDGTLDAIGDISHARLVRHSENLGYGRSILDGIAAGSGELVVMIDADLEYHPEDVPLLLAALETTAAVYGSRFLGKRGGPAVMPRTREAGNRIVSGLFNVLFSQRLTDLYTGLRAVRRNALPPLESPGFELVLELAARLSGDGVRIAEVPIGYTPRTLGRSKMRHVPEFLKFCARLVELRRKIRR